MSRILRDLRIIVQSERLIAQRQFAVVRTRSGLLALAGGAASIGVVMLNVAAFYALRDPLGGAMSALAVAAADFVLAGLLVAVAVRINADRETESATQVRDMAIADLEREVQLATRDLELARAQLGAFARDPGGMVLGKVFEVVMGLLSRKGD